MANKYKYDIYIDDEEYLGVSYVDYARDKKINSRVMNPDRRRLVLGTKVYSYDIDYLLEHKDKMEEFEYLSRDYMLNRLKYFCPNSVEQLNFLNDWDHDVVGLVAPNRVGKSTCGVIKVLLSGIIELDKDWPIFKNHGVEWRPYRGGMQQIKFGLGSYEWSHVKSVLWPRIREYVPDEMLGVYSRMSRGKRRVNQRKDPNFERSPIVELSNGTMLKFHAYSQSQANYESDAYNGFMYDEQPPENIFNAIDERTRTLRGRHYFTLTPHKVEGRPDTGGGGWLQKFLTGEEKRGHNVKTYNTSLADVPDWIYPEGEKHKALEKWIHEPSRTRNMKMLREGRSRVLGEWHKTSGLVIDDFDEKVHIIDDFKVPDTWTRYRAVDHGITNPTCCLWFAVKPPDKENGSDVFVYREYYSTGKTINENVNEIVRMSGNVRRQREAFADSRTGMVILQYDELQSVEMFAKTVLDSRSFALTDTNTGKPYGHIYKSCGLPCHPASGKLSQHWVPILKELFAVDYTKEHPYSKGVEGKSKIYIFRSCVNIKRELSGWVWEEYRSGGDQRNAKETPRKKDDHGCTALGYACQIPLRYRGDLYRVNVSGDVYARREVMDVEDDSYRGI